MKTFPTQIASAAVKCLLIGGYKTVLLKRGMQGMDLTVYVAFSHRLAETRETDWFPIGLTEKFVAPKGKKFWYLFYYTPGVDCDFSVFASNCDAKLVADYWRYATLDISAARTTSGNGGIVVVMLRTKIAIFVNVTAVSGTSPTLDIKVQAYMENTSQWADLYKINSQNGASDQVKFPQITATGCYILQFDAYCSRLRLYWTIGGTTPSFTFSTEIQDKEPRAL